MPWTLCFQWLCLPSHFSHVFTLVLLFFSEFSPCIIRNSYIPLSDHHLLCRTHFLCPSNHSIYENIQCLDSITLSVQFSSVTQSCPTPCDPMNHSTPGLPVHHQLPESTQTHVHWGGDAIQPSHPLSPLLLLPPVLLSIRVFSNESTLRMRWPKCWNFSFSISPPNEHAGLISFRMDWLDLLVVRGTLKSLQHHSSKASILQHSAFFTVQLSHPYMTSDHVTDHAVISCLIMCLIIIHWSPK